MSVSEQLSQEDEILRQIRLTISTFRTIDPANPRRKGVLYGSYAITSGRRLYKAMRHMGFKNADEFRRSEPEQFKRFVLQPNLRAGWRFGDWLRSAGWPLVIVPGSFYASGWNQEHYMSLWRQVIIIYTRAVALDELEFPFSTGSAEELLIGIQHRKRMFLRRKGRLVPAIPNTCVKLLRQAVDQVSEWGFDPMPLYTLWRQVELTLEAQEQRTSHSA